MKDMILSPWLGIVHIHLEIGGRFPHPWMAHWTEEKAALMCERMILSSLWSAFFSVLTDQLHINTHWIHVTLYTWLSYELKNIMSRMTNNLMSVLSTTHCWAQFSSCKHNAPGCKQLMYNTVNMWQGVSLGLSRSTLLCILYVSKYGKVERGNKVSPFSVWIHFLLESLVHMYWLLCSLDQNMHFLYVPTEWSYTVNILQILSYVSNKSYLWEYLLKVTTLWGHFSKIITCTT